MPLYMDFHKRVNATVEELKRAHLADKAVQQKYGVIYHQFWVNEEERTVFCLVEGPDKETCEAVHQADGQMTCSIVEVQGGLYELFMRRDHMAQKEQARRTSEHADPAMKFVLATTIRKTTAGDVPGRNASRKTENVLKELTLSILGRFHGHEVNWLPDGSIVSVFDSPLNTLQCALQIQAELRGKNQSRADNSAGVGFKMGLSAYGQTLAGNGDAFSRAIIDVGRLCRVAHSGELLISAKIQECCHVKEAVRRSFPGAQLRLLTPQEEVFISSICSIAEEKIAEENFTVDHLCRHIGMSRPQLYRKTVALTGKSPNDFLRDLRMEKALTLIRKKAGNIAEIALEVGYNNPSYFARCFQLRYGCAPSRFVE